MQHFTIDIADHYHGNGDLGTKAVNEEALHTVQHHLYVSNPRRNQFSVGIINDDDSIETYHDLCLGASIYCAYNHLQLLQLLPYHQTNTLPL